MRLLSFSLTLSALVALVASEHSFAQLSVTTSDGTVPLIVPGQPMPDLTAGTVTASRPIVIAQQTSAPAEASPSQPATGYQSKVHIASPGPWGSLEYYPVFMEAPTNLLERFPLPNTRPRWSFPLRDRENLPSLLAKAALPESFSKVLLDTANEVIDSEWIHLFPPIPELEAMTPAMRDVIYTELRKYPINEFHYEPVLILSNDAESWFSHSPLRPDLITKVKAHTYMRGECMAFSDLPALLSYATGEADARHILKCLTRTQTLLVKLRLGPDTDMDALLNYWTTGLNLRRKDIEPMLRSIINTEGAEKIDLAHMLPALPRKLLYTYPDPGAARDGILPDCHWTSLNFFNYSEQPYLLDPRLATSAVLERFAPVDTPYKFGDILFFLDLENGDAFHSCIYIADDIVFTKNGRNVLSPWVLMKISDVKKIYLHDRNGRLQGYRNKNAPKMLGESGGM